MCQPGYYSDGDDVSGRACASCQAGRYLNATGTTSGVSASPPPPPQWIDLVTISNCGGSDADNVCAAGTMTKTEETGWNNRVWDERSCCHDCECTGVRWKVPMPNVAVYCGFSAFNAAGSTDKDGAHQMGSYFFEARNDGNPMRSSQGGPDSGWSNTPISPTLNNDQTSFLEVHLTSTGADLVFGGTTIHSIDRAPADSAYRFGCATSNQNAGFSELAYYTSSSPPPGRADPCTVAGPYSLIGCRPHVCTPPAAASLYNVTEINLDLRTGAFDVVLHGCSDGSIQWDTPSVVACDAPGPYKLTGCSIPITQGNAGTAKTECRTENRDLNCPISQAMYSPLRLWNTSAITSMENFFSGYSSHFTGIVPVSDVSSWDTSNVVSMKRTFFGCWEFAGDVSLWDTSSVVEMEGMFTTAVAFNGNLGAWDVTSVTDMASMFQGASSFNGTGLESWNTDSLTMAEKMFYDATAFAGDVSNWQTSRVTDMNHMQVHMQSIMVDLGTFVSDRLVVVTGFGIAASSTARCRGTPVL